MMREWRTTWAPRLAWYLRQWRARAGLGWLGALLLGVLAAGLAARASHPGPGPEPRPGGAALALAAQPERRASAPDPLRFLPPVGERDALMGQLYSTAAAEGLALDQGEYAQLRAADTPVVRYEITLPVQGSYRQVRRFLAKVMAGEPTLALTRVAFTRNRADEDHVAVELHLVLYLRAEAP
jgi:hypothetical protein